MCHAHPTSFILDFPFSAGLTDAASIGVERLPVDTELDDLVSQVKAKASNLQLEDRAGYLADLIATRMGGPVPISRMKHYNCDMHLAELKLAQQSNVIPIGKVRREGDYDCEGRGGSRGLSSTAV